MVVLLNAKHLISETPVGITYFFETQNDQSTIRRIAHDVFSF